MTQRSKWVQWRTERQVRLKALLGKALFSKKNTFVTRMVKKLLGADHVAINDDPDLLH
jgi:hypothetical protein